MLTPPWGNNDLFQSLPGTCIGRQATFESISQILPGTYIDNYCVVGGLAILTICLLRSKFDIGGVF